MANPDLARLSADFFQVQHSTDPLTATLLGVTGFDGLLPDPSRAGSRAGAAALAEIERRLAIIDPSTLGEADRINHAVLGALAWGARSDLEHSLWEANASAKSYVSPQAMAFQAVPTAPLPDPDAIHGYLQRLEGLSGYFDAIAQRYREAKADGRMPTAVGVRHAITQLSGHLGTEVTRDALLHPDLPGDSTGREKAAAIIEERVRPAMRRLLATLADELMLVARPDDQVGIRFVPGGEEGYQAAVRRHTTTMLSPEEIHQIGLDCLAELAGEWAELGGRVLGTTDLPEIFGRLRQDPALRFERTDQIVAMVAAALRRAEEARPGWFPDYRIPGCVIEEIDPIEVNNAPLAYYRPPAGGTRPGAHCVLTAQPEERFTYEYEALAFHESVPGHHLQIASAQTLAGLPEYRRYLDAEVGAYVEGWGLYCERLADEMGLYTSDVARLGMLSFDALRACRLVVDTGMHHFGWSRSRAADFMWEHTATTQANVDNEIDRYIGWPGQALGYMIGRREIVRLRAQAQQRLAGRFDIRDFHGTVLGNGAVPLNVLDQIVSRWIETADDTKGTR
jgi:uncharacterized protein (DUF885 family)